jgi:hypothetical protein
LKVEGIEAGGYLMEDAVMVGEPSFSTHQNFFE